MIAVVLALLAVALVAIFVTSEVDDDMYRRK